MQPLALGVARRLAEAHSKVCQVMDQMLDDANAWTPERFGGDTILWQECQGAVRFTCIYAREKVEFLDRVPYLLARLPEARPCLPPRPSHLCLPCQSDSQGPYPRQPWLVGGKLCFCFAGELQS